MWPGLRGGALEQLLLNLDTHKNHLEGLLKCRLLSPTPRVSNSVDLGTGLISHIPNKFPDAADAAGAPRLHFKSPVLG